MYIKNKTIPKETPMCIQVKSDTSTPSSKFRALCWDLLGGILSRFAAFGPLEVSVQILGILLDILTS